MKQISTVKLTKRTIFVFRNIGIGSGDSTNKTFKTGDTTTSTITILSTGLRV